MVETKIKELAEYLKSKENEAHIEMPELDGRLKRKDEPKDMLKDWLEAEMGKVPCGFIFKKI